MNNLHLSKEAQNDLAEIKAYITEELENLDAALAIISRITKKIRVLYGRRDYMRILFGDAQSDETDE